MSQKLSREEVLYRQRLLQACGLYGGKLDGSWGPVTSTADQYFEEEAETLKVIGIFDARSERNISGLHLTAQRLARQFLAEANSSAWSVRIISGNRSYEEQNQLFRQGRFGNPPPIVTNARGGYSNHNFAIAWDIGLFSPDGSYLSGDTADEAQEYKKVYELVQHLPLEWGGNWTTIVDLPHYQVPTGRSVSETRALFESGAAFV